MRETQVDPETCHFPLEKAYIDRFAGPGALAVQMRESPQRDKKSQYEFYAFLKVKSHRPRALLRTQ
jgi:hypothetical protein